jgi:hypothetical protein
MSKDEIGDIMKYTGADRTTVEQVLLKHNGNAFEALVELTEVPVVSGAKYIPGSPVVDDGLTPEVREKLGTARKLADLLTFSARNDLRAKASHHPPVQASSSSASLEQR